MAPLLFSRELQVGAEKKPQRRALGDAVEAGVIANETLAYFIGRTYLFMERIGINTDVRLWGTLWVLGLGAASTRPYMKANLVLPIMAEVASGRRAARRSAPVQAFGLLPSTADLTHSRARMTQRGALVAEVTVPAAPAARDGALCGGLLGCGGGVQLRLGRVRRPG